MREGGMKDMTRNWENGLVALGVHKERLRIRRAQRDALRELEANVCLIGWDDGRALGIVDRAIAALDKATRAARKKGRRM
jgi:hypothetical protein